MNATPLLFRRLRLILDCTLIPLIVLIVGANLLPVQAKPGAQDYPQGIMVVDSITTSNLNLESTQPSPDMPLLDNNTLAAMIAAENAALTPSQCFIDLPLISR